MLTPLHSADAQDIGFAPPGGPFGHHHGDLNKDVICPTPGGIATISPSCPTGPPPSHSHPHVRPTDAPEGGHHGHHKGTTTIYPAGAPTVTSMHDLAVDCQGCAGVVFATPTCSFPHHSHESHSHPAATVTVTLMGATKTHWEKGTPTCASPLLSAGGESFAGATTTAVAA